MTTAESSVPGAPESYTRRFFAGQRAGSDRSAQRIVSLVMRQVAPASVVDVGCGVGAWLAAFEREGVGDLVGLDGGYVPRDMLQIAQDRFIAADLKSPPDLGRTFDLALSLEVAEHLPEQAAEGFVATLCGLAPVVLFSAAVPLQGGTGHVNERPQSYWAERFESRGYAAIDAIRPEIWNDDAVRFWYRQNTLLYANGRALEGNATLRELAGRTERRMLDVVHPALLEHRNQQPQIELRAFLPRWAKMKAAALKSRA